MCDAGLATTRATGEIVAEDSRHIVGGETARFSGPVVPTFDFDESGLEIVAVPPSLPFDKFGQIAPILPEGLFAGGPS